MPTYLVIARDRPDAGDLRAQTRPRHLEYLSARTIDIILSGPILTEDERMVGSMFVISAPDRATVEAFLAADPYAIAGLFDSVSIERWRQVIPAQ